MPSAEKRRYKRFEHKTPVQLIFKDKRGRKTKALGVSRNISLGGMYFDIDQRIEKDLVVKVKFSPPSFLIDKFFDYKCNIKGKVVRTEQPSNPPFKTTLAVEFNKNLQDFVFEHVYKPLKRNSAILIIFVIMNIFMLKSINVEYFWHQPIVNIYSILVATYILTRFLFASLYTPVGNKNNEPTVSIIIPVRNEEKLIELVVRSCYDIDYPEDKFEVIAIDDHSTDNTSKELMRMKGIYNTLGILSFNKHMGKRDAMAEGILKARGEIVVFIDSDSFLSAESVRNIVQDFDDAKVAAVAGRTDVHNYNTNVLTKMQAVRYYVAFQVLKAAESIFGCVTCCPGCFSAYRKAHLLEVFDKWRRQKFLGVRVTFGDDRSLTKYLLRNHKILYNSQAVAATVVPETYKVFFSQQLRWKKSWVRETFLASSFMWRKNILMSLSFYAGFVLPLISPFVAFVSIIYRPIVFKTPFYIYLYGAFLMSLIYAMFYRMERPSKIWKYGIYFCFFYMAVLTWQTYYALFTVNKTGWGSRGSTMGDI